MTLEPGVWDHEEAPWWEFTCAGCTPVVTQWMGQAARLFGAELTARAAGGECTVRCVFTSLDGNTGNYAVQMSERRDPVYVIVVRGDMTDKPTDI